MSKEARSLTHNVRFTPTEYQKLNSIAGDSGFTDNVAGFIRLAIRKYPALKSQNTAQLQVIIRTEKQFDTFHAAANRVAETLGESHQFQNADDAILHYLNRAASLQETVDTLEEEIQQVRASNAENHTRIEELLEAESGAKLSKAEYDRALEGKRVAEAKVREIEAQCKDLEDERNTLQGYINAIADKLKISAPVDSILVKIGDISAETSRLKLEKQRMQNNIETLRALLKQSIFALAWARLTQRFRKKKAEASE